ncbi:MAG: hypothetical protein K9L82_15305 [Chromatiaceae bacterium]|nr:hypothetical protein [Chromatiaceae bacterium]
MPPTQAHLTHPTTPIAIIGLGDVGLPLAVEFGKQRPVIGFDIHQARVAELQAGHDSTRETTPEDLAAARHIKNRMGAHVAERVVKLMLKQGTDLSHSRVLVLGLTFKENCPDLRNTRVIDIIRALKDDNLSVDSDDPWVDRTGAKQELGIDCLPELPTAGTYGAIILAVAHREFIELGAAAIRALGVPGASILYDVKSALPAREVDARL